VYDRIFPLSQVFYRAPLLDMHNRMKEALVLLGRLDRAVVRGPLQRISAAERAQIKTALQNAQLLPRPGDAKG
jgi:4-hydroxy-tetrahydrodipicolinate synthase